MGYPAGARFKKVAATDVAAPPAGKIHLFADTADDLLKIRDSTNALRILVEAALAQVLTNKTFDASLNTLSNVALSMFAAGAIDTDGTLAANSDAKLATQKAIRTYIASLVTGYLKRKGATDCSANPNYPAALDGDAYLVTVQGKIGGAGGVSVDVGDVFFATADNAGGTQAAVGASWDVLEHNLVGALLAANNLSDVNGSAARTNLDVAYTTLSPAQITSNQNDFNAGTLTRYSFVRFSTDASRKVTGLTGGVDGYVVRLTNIGTKWAVLTNEDASSSAANRFSFAASGVEANYLLPPNASGEFIYDGTSSRWRPLTTRPTRFPIARSAVPLFVAPSGSFANNGAVTLGTALTRIYSGGLYLYYPANAIVAGSAAGLYFTIMSSTTVGVVYNNTYTGGVPTIPASPTAFATTGPGAYTQATGAAIVLPSVTVPGMLMGPSGALNFEYLAQNNNSAGTKQYRLRYGGSNIGTTTATTNISIHAISDVWNLGVTNMQTGNLAISGGTTGAMFLGAINSDSDQTADFSFNNNTATDYAGVESFGVTLVIP